MINISKVNKKLKEERLKNGYTLKDMANFLGYRSQSTYAFLENGVTEPKLEVMNKLADIYQKPVQYFFDIKVQENCHFDEEVKEE